MTPDKKKRESHETNRKKKRESHETNSEKPNRLELVYSRIFNHRILATPINARLVPTSG